MEFMTKDAEPLDIWLPESQIRDYFWISRDTVRRFREMGLPYIGHGRLRRYHLPTIIRWMGDMRRLIKSMKEPTIFAEPR